MKLSLLIAGILISIIATAGPLPTDSPSGRPQNEKLRQYVYIVRLVPRLFEQKAWTEQDREAAMKHFERLKAAGERGPIILAGRTEEPADKTFEIVVFEAPDEATARAFMENDPAVKARIMTAELHPYMIAVQRNPER